MSKTIKVLIEDLPFLVDHEGKSTVEVSGISIDSRKVKKGDLFIAMKGESADGHDFIHAAIMQGAVAVMGEKSPEKLKVPFIKVENSRAAATWVAAAYFDFPGKRLTVIGVTGTDGKTTTCNMLYKILVAAGFKTGMISTVNAIIDDEVIDTGFHVTTPDAPEIQEYMARMVEKGITHVILETTSHGLSQHRVDAAFYDVGIITNVTHEHLDQHGSFNNYLEAKSRLLRLLENTPAYKSNTPKLAVINYDDQSYGYLASVAKSPIISYGLSEKADVYASHATYSQAGTTFNVTGQHFDFQVKSALIGEFNVYNSLAAISGAMIGLGVGERHVKEGIEHFTGIPGRMERIELGQPFTAIVDFAHTPNALRVAINTINFLSHNKIFLIFGSAGLRDREKRQLMAATSIRLGDISIFTAEDPRTESLPDILGEMAASAMKNGGIEGKTYFCIEDRGEAIKKAISLAEPGDIVMACGKGHEQSMCFGNVEYPWDDRVAMKAAISEWLHIPGPKMPYLPTQNKKE